MKEKDSIVWIPTMELKYITGKFLYRILGDEYEKNIALHQKFIDNFGNEKWELIKVEIINK